MLAVGAGVREALEALGALERLFATVQPFVFSQVMLVLERLRALLALVRPLPGMFILVSRERTVLRKRLVALIAKVKTFLFNVDWRMDVWMNWTITLALRLRMRLTLALVINLTSSSRLLLPHFHRVSGLLVYDQW